MRYLMILGCDWMVLDSCDCVLVKTATPISKTSSRHRNIIRNILGDEFQITIGLNKTQCLDTVKLSLSSYLTITVVTTSKRFLSKRFPQALLMRYILRKNWEASCTLRFMKRQEI